MYFGHVSICGKHSRNMAQKTLKIGAKEIAIACYGLKACEDLSSAGPPGPTHAEDVIRPPSLFVSQAANYRVAPFF